MVDIGLKLKIAAVVVSVIGIPVAASFALTIRLVDENNHKFCTYLETVIARSPKPRNPATNPSKEALYKVSVKTDNFEKSIGCR
jgi:hypothetical protein